MKVEFVQGAVAQCDAGWTSVVLARDGATLACRSAGFGDDDLARARQIAMRGRFAGKPGETFEIAGAAWTKADRLILVGIGDAAADDAIAFEHAGAHAFLRAGKSESRGIEFELGDFGPHEAARVAFGVLLGAYRFDRHRTERPVKDAPAIERLSIVTPHVDAARAAFAELAGLAEGVAMARDLVSEPPNFLTPETFADRMLALTVEGLSATVLDEDEMRALGMRALLGVGQGSANRSRLVVLRWQGAPDTAAPPVALVGKGVTFDAGGLSIKGAKDMEWMKVDMGGAAAVAGAIVALARRKAPVNVVGVLGLVENMPDGAAQRPGDVVRSMSGQTIEVLNADAEGRLVLADALWYAQKAFAPRAMIDIATLTGHITYALGKDYGGLFSNDDALADALLAASAAEDEPLWRLPLVKTYEKMLETPVADMKNVASVSDAGAIVAALFLQRFVKHVPWAHLDIAAVLAAQHTRPTVPVGATGFGVRVLAGAVARLFEDDAQAA